MSGVILAALSGLGRLVGWRGAAALGLAALAGGMAWHAGQLDRALDAERARAAILSRDLADARALADAERAERARMAGEAGRAFDVASQSCRQSIRAAVAAIRLPRVQPEPRSTDAANPSDAAGARPSVCDCPSVRLRDIQTAGAAPAGGD